MDEKQEVENREQVVQEVETNSIVIKKTNVLAQISFILCLVGIFIAGLPCGIAALITGIIGLVKFDANKEKNRWMAITGIAVGACEIVIMIIYMAMV